MRAASAEEAASNGHADRKLRSRCRRRVLKAFDVRFALFRKFKRRRDVTDEEAHRCDVLISTKRRNYLRFGEALSAPSIVELELKEERTTTVFACLFPAPPVTGS
jgi:hypothetical protein